MIRGSRSITSTSCHDQTLAPTRNAESFDPEHLSALIVPTLCVGMPQRTLRVRFWDAERPGLHSHADGSTPRRGNDQAFSPPPQRSR
ncbi:hypothetical protein CUN61_06255 [Pseudomonas arsenicoxydans]|uniref:Uncharacterized protein n=1 Tax=Pseudomonas arsenicoxydans TaxID=702115 RepID=A0A4P6G2M1_9PSED|nr:hypothetical protein CUN61_06255 [Pseudomonas arsenicoxydans]